MEGLALQNRMNSGGRFLAPALTGYKILVVEDNPEMRTLLTLMLRLQGAEISSASSAREALDLIRNESSFKLPDLILSDIAMPDEDGFSLIKKVRSLPLEKGGQIPAIAMTSFSGDEVRSNAKAAGFQAFLPKPLEPEELIHTITQLISHTVH